MLPSRIAIGPNVSQLSRKRSGWLIRSEEKKLTLRELFMENRTALPIQ
jgi:hypothetical protein